MRRTPGLKQINDVLRLWRKMRAEGPARIIRLRGEHILLMQCRQRQRAHARAALLEKLAPRYLLQAFKIVRFHTYPFVTISSRFSNTLPTIIQAASLWASRYRGR